jgi:PAS domain-containing protein
MWAFRSREAAVFQALLDGKPTQGEFAKNDDNGPRLRITMSDVTKPVDAERAVRIERSRLKTVLDATNDPVFVKDNEPPSHSPTAPSTSCSTWMKAP